jgi:LPS sulfotransferase NodH
MTKFLDLFKKKKKTIILVSGLPRSGTSMMMKMLEAGGVTPLTDNIRTADQDNPKGYYEFERAKKLRQGDDAWLAQAEGKAVKTISALLEHLPDSYHYKVFFMRRAMPEIMASQKKMLVNRGEDPDKVDDQEMSALFEKHLLKVTTWLAENPHFEVLDVNYNELLADPAPWIQRICSFLDRPLDTEKMATVIDPQLYRQRA